jgi:hypothetical protein
MNMMGTDATPVFDEFEQTAEELPYFYMPYWTPLEAIQWLSMRASGMETGTAGYVYYQTPYDVNFVTLEKLFQSKTVELAPDGTVLPYVPFTSGRDRTALTTNYKNTILGWKMSPVDMSAFGVIKGGHKLGYDFSKKLLIDQSYTYAKAIPLYTMLGKKTLFPDVSDDTMRYTLEGDSNTKILDNMYYNDFIRRYSKQFAFIATVDGSDDRYAGMMVDLQWPSAVDTEFGHKSLRGLYLVKSITHQFSGMMQPPYRQVMVLLKNAYEDSYSTTLMNSSKINMDVKSAKIGNYPV